MKFSYKNSVNFFSCFVRRRIMIDSPTIKIKNADFGIACRKATILPDFHELINSRTIILNCTFERASFLKLKEQLAASNDLQSFLANNAYPLAMARLLNVNFETMRTRLVMHGNRVDFTFFEAESKDIEVSAAGFATEDGDFDISGKISFSPEISETFPQELRVMLTEDSRGWLTYSLRVASSQSDSSLKIESDLIKIDFKEVKVN